MKLRDYFKTVFSYSPKKIMLVVACMLLAGALEGISFALFAPLIQVMTRGESGITLPWLGIPATVPTLLIGLILLFGGKAAFLFCQKWYSSHLALDFERALKQDIYSSVFSSDWKFFMREKTGTLTNAMSQNARIAADAFRVFTLMCAEIVNITIYCVVGIWMSLPAFCLSAVAGGASFFFLRGYINRSREIGAQAVALKNATIGSVIEDFTGIKSIKSNHLEGLRAQGVSRMLSDVMRLELRGEKFAAIMDSMPEFVMACMACLVLGISYYWLRVPGENLLVLIVVLYRLNRRVLLFQGYKQRLFLYLPYYELCHGIISRAGSRREVSGSRSFETLKEGIELKEVCFSYDDHSVLKSLSMKIRKNQITAVVGRSGTGKTTVVDIVTGLLRPDSGRVLLDGRDLNEYDAVSWRSRLAYVAQEILLVNGSIEDNIRMDNALATAEEVSEAARQAHADEFIRRQPQGYRTLVGDRGLALSGGQRQRIALARALLRKPELLILDEATSALDSESEKMVQDTIDALRGKLTILVVAHRFSTIERSDIVYVLDQGRSTESGAASELKERSGTFQQLYDLR